MDYYQSRLDVINDEAFNFLSEGAYNCRERVEVYSYTYSYVQQKTAQMDYQVSDPAGVPYYAADVPDASSAYSSHEDYSTMMDSTLSYGMRQQTAMPYGSHTRNVSNTATIDANVTCGPAAVTPYPSAYTGPNLPSSESGIYREYIAFRASRSIESYNLTHGSTQSQSTMGSNVTQPGTTDNTVPTEPWLPNLSHGSTQSQSTMGSNVAQPGTPNNTVHTEPWLPNLTHGSTQSQSTTGSNVAQPATPNNTLHIEPWWVNLTPGSTQSQSTTGSNVAQPATPNNTLHNEPWWVNLTPGTTQSQATMESDIAQPATLNTARTNVAQHVASNATVRPAQSNNGTNVAQNTASNTGSRNLAHVSQSTGSNHSNAQPQVQNTSPSHSKSSKNHLQPQGSTSDEKNRRQESNTYYHAKITISMETSTSTSSTHEVKKEGKSKSSVWDADLRKYCSIKPERQKAKLPIATGHGTSKQSAKKKGIAKPEKKNKNMTEYECNVCHIMYKLQRMLTHLQSEHGIEAPNVKHHCTIRMYVVCAKCEAKIVQHLFNRHIKQVHAKAN